MTVDYKPLANGVGANVETQAAYVADLGVGGALEHGYGTGVVRSERFNKTLRQSSVMTAALAEQIAAKLAVDVLDDGDVAALQTLINNAFLSYLPTGSNAQRLPYSAKALETRSIREFATSAPVLTGGADAFNTIQYALDAMAAGEFSRLIIPPNVTLLVTGTGRTLSLSDTVDTAVIEWQGNAYICTENSDNPDAPPGNWHFITLGLHPNKMTLINPRIRGATIAVYGDIVDFWGGKGWNLNNTFVTIGDAAFSKVNFYGTEIDTSLATALSVGNFSAIQRAAPTTGIAGGIVAAFGVKFRGLSGSLDVHSLRDLVCCGCEFSGGDGLHVKVTTADNGATGPDMNVSMIANKMNGAAINGASANIHLANPTAYGMFIQRFQDVDIAGGSFENYAGTAAIDFLDGSFSRANCRIRSTFKNNPATYTIRGPQGVWEIRSSFDTCGPVDVGGALYQTRSGLVEGSSFKDTRLVLGDRGEDSNGASRIVARNNYHDWGLDNLGAIIASVTATVIKNDVLVKESTIKLRGVGNNVAIGVTGGAGFVRAFDLTLLKDPAAPAVATPGLSGKGAFPAINSDSGFPTIPNAAATTIFSPFAEGLYLVSAWTAVAGQQAAARVHKNAAGLILLDTTSGSGLLSISVSGANVQVTQTNGGGAVVYWTYQVIGRQGA